MRPLALLAALALAACSVNTPTPEPPAAPARLMAWPDLLSRPRPKEDATVRYGDDPYQVVDVWLPKGAGPHPTVLMVHGGCWQTAIADRTIMNWIADDLRKRGIAVWNIDYRGVDRPGGGFPGTFDDVGAAADALRANAGRYRLDIARLVATGHSAGGHLALWLAARTRITLAGARGVADGPIPIRSVVSLGGLPDLEQAVAEKQGCGAEVIGRLTGGRFADTSIPRLAPLGVPQVLVNGDRDRIIPTNFAGDYAAKMKRAGDHVTVRIVSNQGHVELIAPDSAAWAVAVEEIERALGGRIVMTMSGDSDIAVG